MVIKWCMKNRMLRLPISTKIRYTPRFSIRSRDLSLRQGLLQVSLIFSRHAFNLPVPFYFHRAYVFLLLVVFLGMLGDVLKSSLDCGWYRGRSGQVSTLRLESVLVGYVRDLEGVAVGVGITEATSCL